MAFGTNNKVDNDDRPIFIGGFCGVSKKDDKERPWFCLQFAVKPTKERDNSFGWDVANCYVEADTYKKFTITNREMTKIDAQIMYVNHGWALCTYNF